MSTPEELRAEIEQQREALAETVGVPEARLEADPDHVGQVRVAGDGGPAGQGTALPAVAYNDLAENPHADHPDKAQSPTDLPRSSFVATFKRAIAEFSADQCTDLAAALTYYSVLAVFPAALAMLSLMGVVVDPRTAVDTVMDVLRPLVSSGTLDSIRPTLRSLATADGAGVTLVIGVLGALWSASGYVGAFGRAMNRILEVEEGRPFWKLRPMQLLVTLVTVLLCAVSLLILIVSGPVARSIGDRLGVGDSAVLVWNIAKWPVLLVVVLVVVALLYWATPNVRQPRFRWLSVGAFFAVLVWLVASVGFAFYVANFSSYNKTYGSVAGVVVALLWIWITNVALLLGAEIDSELERNRELHAGIDAAEQLQLPLRDDRQILKGAKKRDAMVAAANDVRERADES